MKKPQAFAEEYKMRSISNNSQTKLVVNKEGLSKHISAMLSKTALIVLIRPVHVRGSQANAFLEIIQSILI